MTTFHLLSNRETLKLHVWRDKTAQNPSELAYDVPASARDSNGLITFRTALDSQVHGDVHALVRDGDTWEKPEHAKTLPRVRQYRFPAEIWCAWGAARLLAEDPFAVAHHRVRIHLITAVRYREGQLVMWSFGNTDRTIPAAGTDQYGPYFDAQLTARERHLFCFRFRKASGELEPEFASRLWSARDGAEIWVHSESAQIGSRPPTLENLVVHYCAPDGLGDAIMHLWQENSDFVADIPGTPIAGGEVRFEFPIYTDISYRFIFQQPQRTAARWEHEEARRNVFLREGATWTTDGDGTERRLGTEGAWTLEGDHELFGSKPSPEQELVVEIVASAPDSVLPVPRVLDVWVNRARALMLTGVAAGADGRWTVPVHADVVTSFRFRAGENTEKTERHTVKISGGSPATQCFVVLGRAEPLQRKPVEALFLDPPFAIERPGAWLAGDQVRFALHCPTAATVEIVGEWTDWEVAPVPMRSTRDGTYWWAEIPVTSITNATQRPSIHGVLYKYRLDQIRRVQDPAADWVENSDLERASKLVDHRLYSWRSNDWARPGWEYLTIYQLHPSRFSGRGGAKGLAAATRELTAPDGYLRKVNATALLLMPICEFAGDQGWGYNPSFYYAVESAYGGPDALKAFVDAAHERGLAVLLDVVFNHAGASDNVMWSVASQSYFDGDTEWGAMINFDHPQVGHFFEQNLLHYMKHFRVDGFRFDFTRVIRYGDTWTDFVRRPGSGGGWGFMKRLQGAVRAMDGRCLMMAENYPNEWDLTRTDGPMDTQWGDDFHDRVVDAARGWDVMGPLGRAMILTHLECDHWHEATHFPESHDEVGNVPDRIANVAGPGRGLRRNKVAAAATLFSRGIPLWFMGAESGEWRQFSKDGGDTLDLDAYESDVALTHVRAWWNKLCELRRGNNRIEGPAPVRIHYAQGGMIAFSRGDGADWFVVLNFSDQAGERSLAPLNLPDGEYKELLNSTWPPYQVEWEEEHPNGGWNARLRREYNLNVPDYGVVILERA